MILAKKYMTLRNRCRASLLTLLLSFNANALEASGCVKTTGSDSKDKVIATAIAKGNLAHDMGSTVTANRNLETKTIESKSSVETIDTLNETVAIESKHYISRVTTTAQGYEQINGEKHYCVHLKQGI
jgi:hypothetical protein